MANLEEYDVAAAPARADRVVTAVPSMAQSQSERRVVAERPAWSPMQFVALVIGILYIVFGAVALARGGIHFNYIPGTYTKVAGLGFTCVSGLVVLVAGVIIAAGGARPYSARSIGWVFGIASFAFGLVVALSPSTFFRVWGFSTADGVALAICGIVLLIAAAVSPIFVRSSAVQTVNQGVVGGTRY